MASAKMLGPIAVIFLLGAWMSTASGRLPASTSAAALATSRLASAGAASDSADGQYLTTIGGCNDCHTAGWAESNGKTPPAEQLAGSTVGFRGPWGTSYPANLRNVVQRQSEDRWVQVLTTADGGRGLPPMPWMNTAAMTQHDLRAMYRYIHSLGAHGANTPRAVRPDSMPRTPYINFVPVQP